MNYYLIGYKDGINGQTEAGNTIESPIDREHYRNGYNDGHKEFLLLKARLNQDTFVSDEKNIFSTRDIVCVWISSDGEQLNVQYHDQGQHVIKYNSYDSEDKLKALFEKFRSALDA